MAVEKFRNVVYDGPGLTNPRPLPAVITCQFKYCSERREVLKREVARAKKTTFNFHCNIDYPKCEHWIKQGKPNLFVSYPFPRRATYKNNEWHWGIHWGIDIGGQDGVSKVHAAVQSKVFKVAVQTDENGVKKFPKGFGDYGNTILLESVKAPKYYYLYAHLHSVVEGIEEGAIVEEGQHIAFVGRTAYSEKQPEKMFEEEGAHLHFEVARAPIPPATKNIKPVLNPEDITDENNSGKHVNPILHLQGLGPWGGPKVYLPVSELKTPELSAHELSAARIEMAYNSVELHNDSGGYFPLGVNRLWHGGVHLTGPSDSLVRAPFSGEIVAVRLDHDVEKNQGAFGTLSFILLRHEIPETLYAQLQEGTKDSNSNAEEDKWRGKSVGKHLEGKKGPKIDNPPDLVAEVKARLAECEDDTGAPFYAPTPSALVHDGNTIDDDFIDAIIAFQSHISTGWAPDGVITVPKTSWKALEKELAQQREKKKKGAGDDSSQSDKARRDLYCLFMHLRAEGGLAFAEGRLALAKKLPWLSKVQLPLTEAEKKEQASQEEKKQKEKEATAQDLEYVLTTTVGQAPPGKPKYNGAADVEWVKRRLRHLGFDPKSTDGVFTPALKDAIVAFQEKHVSWFRNNNKKGDGIIGPKGSTQEALRKTRVEIDAEESAASEDKRGKTSPTDLDSKFVEALEKRAPGDLAPVIVRLGVTVPAGEPLWQISAIPVAPADGCTVPESFEKPFIHWELFSKDPMVKSWEILEDDGNSVVSEDEIPIVTLIEEKEGIDKYSFLDATKIRAFFKSDRSNFLRQTQVRFRSEWDIDVDKTVGIIEQKGYDVEGFKDQLIPYQWWADAKDVLPESSSVWHTHPIGFLEKLFSYCSSPGVPGDTEPAGQ